ncbi:MAG: hypothetical protein N2485_00135 [bacterium]|nr:hypothetical protein [bacterium]
MKIQNNNYFFVNTKQNYKNSTPDYNYDELGNKKDKPNYNPDNDEDYYSGGNSYEYSGPDGTYEYDPYH